VVQIKLVADVLVRAGDRVLLVRYADPEKYDDERGWFLPDDFLRHGEHPADAAKRILADQVGITAVDLTLDHVESFDGEDWHLIFHFKAEPVHPDLPHASRDVAEARWFSLTALPPRADVAHDGWALDLIAAMSPAEVRARSR
jgi:ADP-ribose pyrophosphatase YjhB (NUDIX family)